MNSRWSIPRCGTRRRRLGEHLQQVRPDESLRTETNTSTPQILCYVDAARCQANGGTNYGTIANYPDFSFPAIVKTNGQIRLTLGVANPGTNRTAISTHLGNWSVVHSGITNTGCLNFTDAVPTSAARFYRAVRIAPCGAWAAVFKNRFAIGDKRAARRPAPCRRNFRLAERRQTSKIRSWNGTD